MILYHKGERLAGPCFNVSLTTSFLFGAAYVSAARSQFSRWISASAGPITMQYWWPPKRTAIKMSAVFEL